MSDTQSAHLRLANDLRESILRGQGADGSQLPTELELIERYGVSRQTVRRAFQSLVSEGLVYRIAGRGTFASPSHVQHLNHLGTFENMPGQPENADFELLEPLRVCVDVAAAARLGLASDLIGHLSFRLLSSGQPVSLTHAFVPPDIEKRLSKIIELHEAGKSRAPSLIGIIERDLGITLSEAQQSISAVRPNSETRELLKVSDVVLRTDRLYRDSDGKAVHLSVTFANPSSSVYQVRLRRNSLL